METSRENRTVGDRETVFPSGEPPHYPISLKVAGERCLVVGGGAIARRKSEDLLACGALVHLVAPEWRDDFDAPADPERLVRSTRPFAPADLDGVRVVVAATDDREVQDAVARGAAARGIPCNVVDVNPLCSFYVPAVLRRGSLTVAVATDGKFPLLAAALRDRIAAAFGPQLGPALERLREGRRLVFERWPGDAAARRRSLDRLLTPEALELILADRLADFERHWEAWKSGLGECP